MSLAYEAVWTLTLMIKIEKIETTTLILEEFQTLRIITINIKGKPGKVK